MRDIPHELGAQRADDTGKKGSAEQAEDDEPGAHLRLQLVDQDVNPDVDAGAHAVGGAELGHPDEHVDAQFLGPAQVGGEQPVLQRRPRYARRIAVHHGNEDDDGRGAHHERDQPLLQMVEHLVQARPPPGVTVDERQRPRLELQLVRIESCVFVNFLDQILADGGFVIPVHFQHRLFPGLLLFRRQRDDLRLARGLHLFQSLVVLLFRDVIGEGGGLLHRALERGAEVGRQTFPELLVDDHRVLDDAMVRQRQILLHLVHFLRIEVGGGILGAIHDAGLQCLIDLGKCHDLRRRTQRAHLAVEHLGGLDAHLQAAEIGRRSERLVGAHLLEAIVPVGQTDDALAVQFLEQLLADSALGHVVQVFGVVENVRQVEHFEFARTERAELRHRRREHLHVTQLQHLHLFAVLEQLAVRINLDLDPALGARFGELLEFQGALAFGRILGDDMAELDDDRLLGIRRADGQRGKQYCEHDFAFQIHETLLTLNVRLVYAATAQTYRFAPDQEKQITTKILLSLLDYFRYDLPLFLHPWQHGQYQQSQDQQNHTQGDWPGKENGRAAVGHDQGLAQGIFHHWPQD